MGLWPGHRGARPRGHPRLSRSAPRHRTTRGELTAVSWREVPLLIRRQGGTMATLGNKVVLFGGIGNNVHGDTWEWDGTAGTRKSPAASPPARNGAAMAALGSKLVLFGGEGPTAPLNDTWEWDGTNWTQRTPATSPPARFSGAIAALSGKLVLFGGSSPPDRTPLRRNQHHLRVAAGKLPHAPDRAPGVHARPTVPAAALAKAPRAGPGAGQLDPNPGAVRGAAGPSRQRLPPGRARPADLTSPAPRVALPELRQLPVARPTRSSGRIPQTRAHSFRW